MSELEVCRLAHEGKVDELKKKLNEFSESANMKDLSDRGIVHWAAVGGHVDIINFVHNEYKLQLDEPDETGWSPLMIACSAGHFNVVKFLIENKCDVNTKNINGQTCLFYAASRNRLEIARYLLENGAQVNVADTYGHTPLHRAASKGSLKLLELLIAEYKANINACDREGNTPLHVVCEEERVDVAKLFLKFGANPYIKNKDEKTPIDVSQGGLLNLIENNE